MRGVGLEPLDALGPVPGPAVEVLVFHPLGVEPVADQPEELGELREDQDLVPFLGHLDELGDQHVELGAGVAGRARGRSGRGGRRPAGASSRASRTSILDRPSSAVSLRNRAWR